MLDLLPMVSGHVGRAPVQVEHCLALGPARLRVQLAVLLSV